MARKPTYNDFREAKPKELMRVYKMNPRQLEMAHRDVLSGAKTVEMRKEYDKFYRRNRADA